MFGTENENQTSAGTLFKPKSFIPRVSNPSIKTFCRVVEQEILNTFTSVPYYLHHNLSKEETKVIKELADDTEIIIKPADKGGQ